MTKQEIHDCEDPLAIENEFFTRVVRWTENKTGTGYDSPDGKYEEHQGGMIDNPIRLIDLLFMLKTYASPGLIVSVCMDVRSVDEDMIFQAEVSVVGDFSPQRCIKSRNLNIAVMKACLLYELIEREHKRRESLRK